MYFDAGERRNYNAYGQLVTDAFRNFNVYTIPTETFNRVTLSYQVRDLSLLADHVDQAMKTLAASGNTADRRAEEAVAFRYVLTLSNLYEDIPPLTNTFPVIGEIIQPYELSGNLDEEKSGVGKEKAKQLTNRGLNRIARYLYTQPELARLFTPKPHI